MKSILALVLLSASFSFAVPLSINCDSEDMYDPVNKNGNATFIMKNFLAANKKEKQELVLLFSGSIMCGHETSTLAFKPVCKLKDDSSTGLYIYNVDCSYTDEAGSTQWYALANLTITASKSGLFTCNLKNGKRASLKLSNCIAL